MSLSWKELVLHGLLKKICLYRGGDPSLLKELLKVVMKEHRDHLEKEAREFHSENVGPVVGVYREQLSRWGHTGLVERRCKAAARRDEERERSELWLTAINYNNLKYEFDCSWKARTPEQRRRAAMMHKESTLLRWRGHSDYDITSGRARDLDIDYHSIEKSIKWYGEIHEGRYYLFWDKKLALPIADWAARARRQSKAFLMSGFDINIIDGEGLGNNIPESWVYAYDQWTTNPMGWGARKAEFTMVHGIGKKEKMHIDDIFLKE